MYYICNIMWKIWATLQINALIFLQVPFCDLFGRNNLWKLRGYSSHVFNTSGISCKWFKTIVKSFVPLLGFQWVITLFLNPTCAFTTAIDGVLGVVCVGHHQAAMIVRTLQFMDSACIDAWPMRSTPPLPFGQTSSLPAPKRIRSLTLKSPSQALAKPSSWPWVLESLEGGDDIAAATRFNSGRTWLYQFIPKITLIFSLGQCSLTQWYFWIAGISHGSQKH